MIVVMSPVHLAVDLTRNVCYHGRKLRLFLKEVQKKDTCVERPLFVWERRTSVLLGADPEPFPRTYRAVGSGAQALRLQDESEGAVLRQDCHRNGACERGGQEGVDGA